MVGNISKNVVSVEAKYFTTGAEEFVKKTKNISRANREMETALKSSEKESKKAGLQLEKDARAGEISIERERKSRKKQEQSITNVEKRQERFNKIQKEHGLNQAAASKTLQAAGLKVDKVGEVVNVAGKKQRNYNQALRNNIGASRKFQMEQLGVMFAGMALNRAMSTLSATSREWVGVGELMSTMMGVVMLPTTMDLLNFGVLPLFDALTNLPEGAQKAIGLVALGLEALGGVMLVGGQLMLGMDSTATLLSKIAGVKPELIFTSKGLKGLSDKLAPVMKNLKNMAAGVVIGFAIKDLVEGDVMGAISKSMIAAGLYFNNGWLIGAGVVLTLASDGMLAEWSVKFFDMIGFAAEWASDTLSKAITGNFADIDFSAFSGLFDDMDKVAAERVLSGEAMSAALINRVGGVRGALDTLNRSELEALREIDDEYDKGIISTHEEYLEQIDKTKKEFAWIAEVSLPKVAAAYEPIIERGESVLSNLLKITSIGKAASTASSTFGSLGFNPVSFISNLFSGDEGNKAVGGRVNRTGRYFLHEGEEVINKNQTASGVALQVTYNVTVSDKREFEQMLRANNEKLTSDVRRMAKT